MSTTTQASAPNSYAAQGEQVAGAHVAPKSQRRAGERPRATAISQSRVAGVSAQADAWNRSPGGAQRRVDTSHASGTPTVPLCWTEYVQAFAASPTRVDNPTRVATPIAGPATVATRSNTIVSPRTNRLSRGSFVKAADTAAELPGGSRIKTDVSPAVPCDRALQTGMHRQRFYPEQWRRQQQKAIERLVAAHGERIQWVGWDRSLPQLYIPAGQLTRVMLDLIRYSLREAGSARAGELSLCLRVGWQSGVTQALVVVFEHPQLELPADLQAYINAPLLPWPRPVPAPANAKEFMLVRAMLKELGASITASRAKGGGTQFRIAVPVDDRTTLVRAWLERTAHAIQSTGSQALGIRSPQPRFWQARVKLFAVGRANSETVEALNEADALLQGKASVGDFVYRAARGRWLWLTTHSELPTFDSPAQWRSQLFRSWDCMVETTLIGEQHTAAFHGLARSIVAAMDTALGGRVPPLDSLSVSTPKSGRLRFDQGSAPVLRRSAQRSARVSLGESTALPLGTRRWRYPI